MQRRKTWGNHYRVALAAALLLAACGDSTGPDRGDELLSRLDALPGVEATEIQAYYGYARAFQLDITQPVDHRRPDGPTFTQRAYLSHADTAAPMVFAPSGYGTTPESGQELAWILQASCLSVSHRYFPDSRPSPLDWRYLDIWQAAQDHHRIVTLLKEIYAGPWVSAGASKGGETVLFHRRFHPDDVAATVAYVAPLLLSPADPRLPPYLRGLGTAEDTAAIHDYQRRLLERKDDLLDEFAAWFPANGWSLSLPPGPVFEEAVVAYEWGFWQRHEFGRSDIPRLLATDRQMVDHLARVTRLHFDSDGYRDYFSAYVYQTRTEIGGVEIPADHLGGLLTEEPVDIRVAYGFPPGLDLAYRADVIPDILDWVRTAGDRIILIYGALDPWTGGAIELTGATDALKVVQPGADHQVRIVDLDRRDEVLDRLGGWLGLDIAIPADPGSLIAPPVLDRAPTSLAPAVGGS